MDTTTEEKTMSATETLSEASAEWYAWRDHMSLTCESNSLGAMVCFEQVALHSEKTKRCMECGEAGTVQQSPTAYNHVPYWFCDDCDAYWKAKG